MKFLITALSFSLLSSVYASALTEKALKYVPGGSVVQEKQKEVKIKTPKGTIVEIEFTATGNFEEASGDNVQLDEFNPGDKNLTLEAAVAAMTKAGKVPAGDWSYEKSMLRGWHYEFEGFENNQKMDYVVDAQTGKIVSETVDD